MSGSSNGLHEAPERLSNKTKDVHRALVSLQEELEAVDWYQQRADACTDDSLRDILLHNMREEIEHATMVLEWLRRNHPTFGANFETYLWSKGAITEVEEAAGGEGAGTDASQPRHHSTSRSTIGDLGRKKP